MVVEDRKKDFGFRFVATQQGQRRWWPSVISEYAKPGCFKDVSSFPADYKANRNTWMNEILFTQWLLKMYLFVGRGKIYYSWLTVGFHIS
jgi:hypothetical protein